MVLALPVAFGVLLALLCRGDVRRLAALQFRRVELFFAAMALQVLAFPFTFLPWHTSDSAATGLWLASYGLLLVAAVVNRGVTGVPVIAAGMMANVAAVVANGGHMPALPSALRGAGLSVHAHFNSTPDSSPRLAWLVDRWVVPRSLHVGNVFSVGDVVIAVGAVVLVFTAMGARRPALLRRTRGTVESTP